MGRKKQYCKSCDWELDLHEKEYPSFHKDNYVDMAGYAAIAAEQDKQGT